MRPTAAGRLVAAASAALLIGAYLLGYPRLAVLGLAGLVALALGTAWVARRPRLELTREIFPAKVSRGEPAVGMLFISNNSRWLGLHIEAREPFGGNELRVPVPRLRAGASREVGYQLPTGKRGVIEVGPLRWERTDVLGLVRRQHALAGLQLLYVHPRTHEFPLSAALRAQRWDSSTSDAAPDGTITFHTLREYVPGDDLRFIHWRSSAKRDELMVRRNIDVSLPVTTVLLVTAAVAYDQADLFEEAVEVAASTLVAAAGQRLPARLVTTDRQAVASAGGRDEAVRFLDFLAGVQLTDAGGLGVAADRLQRAEGGGVLVVATGRLDTGDVVMLRTLANRYDEVIVALLGAGPADEDNVAAEAVLGDLALSVLPAATGAQFCARWHELARR